MSDGAVNIFDPGHVSASLPFQRLEKAIIASAIAIALLVPTLYVRFHITEFGDGAWFSLGVLSDSPWELVWRNFSGRLDAYVLTGVLPHLVFRMTANHDLALAAYGVFWGGLPLASLAMCRILLPRSRQGLMLYPAMWLCIGALSVFGFPTETWITQFVFWPLLFAAMYGNKSPSGQFMFLLLALALVFSHESMVIFVPIVILALVIRHEPETGVTRLYSRVAILAFCLFCFGLTKSLLKPDVTTATALVANAHDIFKVYLLLTNGIFIKIAVIFLLVIFALYIRQTMLNASGHLIVRSVALGCAVSLIILVAYANLAISGDNRYGGRLIIIYGVPLVGLLCVLDGMRPASTRAVIRLCFRSAGLLRLALLGCALPLALMHVIESVRFALEFDRFREVLKETVVGDITSGRSPNFAGARISYEEASKENKSNWRLSWDWVLPYHSVLVAPNLAPARLVFVESHPTYVPLRCEDMSLLDHLPRSTQALLSDYVCPERVRHDTGAIQ